MDLYQTNGSSPPQTAEVEVTALLRFYIGSRANDEQDIAKAEAYLHEQFDEFTVFEGAGTWKGQRIPTTVYECFALDGTVVMIVAYALCQMLDRECVAWASLPAAMGLAYNNGLAAVRS